MDSDQFEKVDKGDIVWIVLDEEYVYPEDDRSITTQPIKPTLFKATVLSKLCDYDNWGAYVHIEGSQRKSEFFQHYSLFLTPEEAVNTYTEILRRRLIKSIKPEDRGRYCHLFGGPCEHIGWCDECPRIVEDEYDECY